MKADLKKKLNSLESKLIEDSKTKLDSRMEIEERYKQDQQQEINKGHDFVKYMLNKQQRQINDLDRFVRGKKQAEYHHLDQVHIPQRERVDSFASLQTLNINNIQPTP